MYALNAMYVTLDKSICQIHNVKKTLFIYMNHLSELIH